MLAPRRRYLDYLKVYSDVTERWLLVWNQNKRYIVHILYSNSKFSIDLPYNNHRFATSAGR